LANSNDNGTIPPPDNDNAGQAPTVTLRASNQTPGLGEEVVLRCSIVSVDSSPATFAFQSSFGRLSVDEQAGTARFTVEESDLGTEITATCTATNDFGTSRPSNRVTILPGP
jgi:hypothetical protein